MRLPLGERVEARAPRASGIVAAALVAAAIAVALSPWSAWVRAGVAAALVVLAAVARQVLVRKRTPPLGWIALDARGVRRVDSAGETALASWDESFGVTVLATADRARCAIVFTSAGATRFVPARVTSDEDAADAPTIVARATIAADSDLRMDEQAALAAPDAERLFGAIARRAPGAVERVMLSDASGEPIVIDSAELRFGARRVDLAAPLEWKPFVFKEKGAVATSVCQATWVRQGEVEVVVVATLPADGLYLAGPEHAGDPPPRELRRAIDHVFMLPLRRALGRAPRPSRSPSSPSYTMRA